MAYPNTSNFLHQGRDGGACGQGVLFDLQSNILAKTRVARKQVFLLRLDFQTRKTHCVFPGKSPGWAAKFHSL